MKIEATVLNVLGDAATSGNGLVLRGELPRPLYVEVNKVLTLAGGKWNRKAKAHLFESDAADIVDALLLTGEITDEKKEFDYFPTPLAVVERLLELADIAPGMWVLEPNAGQGAIIRELLRVTNEVEGFELNNKNYEVLLKEFPSTPVTFGDFLAFLPLEGVEEELFDRVVMNPPFSRQQDIKHVNHAFKFLRPGGRLVSVMSASVGFRTNKLSSEFRDLVESTGGFIEHLPEGSFEESGTGVNTVIAVLNKAE